MGEGISPFAITAWRFLIGGLVILPFAIKQGTEHRIKLSLSSILTLGALGILNVVISMLLLQLAIYNGKASLTAVIVSMNPLFVSIFAYSIIKENLSRHQIYSILMGVTGLLVIILGESELRGQGFNNLPLGIVYAVLAGITFALYTVLTKRAVFQFGNRITNCTSFLIGGLSLSLLNLLIGKNMAFEPNMRNILLILYLGVVITGIAYLFYFEAMKELSAARASIYFFLKPGLASIMAFLFLKEHLSIIQVTGIVLIMFALSRRIWMKHI